MITSFYVKDVSGDVQLIKATSPEQAAENFLYSLEDLPMQERFYVAVAESADGPFQAYTVLCVLVPEYAAYKSLSASGQK